MYAVCIRHTWIPSQKRAQARRQLSHLSHLAQGYRFTQPGMSNISFLHKISKESTASDCHQTRQGGSVNRTQSEMNEHPAYSSHLAQKPHRMQLGTSNTSFMHEIRQEPIASDSHQTRQGGSVNRTQTETDERPSYSSDLAQSYSFSQLGTSNMSFMHRIRKEPTASDYHQTRQGGPASRTQTEMNEHPSYSSHLAQKPHRMQLWTSNTSFMHEIRQEPIASDSHQTLQGDSVNRTQTEMDERSSYPSHPAQRYSFTQPGMSNMSFMHKIRKEPTASDSHQTRQARCVDKIQSETGECSRCYIDDWLARIKPVDRLKRRSGYQPIQANVHNPDDLGKKRSVSEDVIRVNTPSTPDLPKAHYRSQGVMFGGTDASRRYQKWLTDAQPQYITANVEFLTRDCIRIHRSPTFGNRDFNSEFPVLKLQDSIRAIDQPNNLPEGHTMSTFNNLHRTFRYTPLPKNQPRSIRLIKFVFSGSLIENDDDIYFEMKTTDPHQDQVQYVCLSYCWGDGSKGRVIYLKQGSETDASFRSLFITENLFCALKSLQTSKAYSTKWIWIDMISINQSDLHERSNQVTMMKKIYENAASVVVWLGESKAAHNALPMISWIYGSLLTETDIGAGSMIGPEGLKLNLQHLDRLESYTKVAISDKTPIETYEILVQFFSLPWFRRVWVLQEASSHRAVTVRIGKHTLPFESVVIAALWQSFLTRNYTRTSDAVLNSIQSTQGYLPELWLDLLHTRKQRGLSMVELVCRARDFEASDPRDKIFAVLGLANDIPTSSNLIPTYLQPNYDKSKELIYMDFAKGLIKDTGHLDILSAVDTFTAQGNKRASASWMPHLDVSIATIRGLGFPKKYDTAFGTKALHSGLSHSYKFGMLSLSGFVIDTISPVISPLLTLSPQLHLHSSLQADAVLDIWTHLFINSSKFKPADILQTLEAFMHTLTAAGFAFSRSFPEYPLGQIRPPQNVSWIILDFAAYWARIDPTFSLLGLDDPTDFMEYASVGDADQFAVLSGKACHERKFFFSEQSRMGLCPRHAKAGDKIVVLYGGSVPYVLRQEMNDSWTFVGECYVDGIMFGEAQKIKEDFKIEDQVFHIR